MNFNRQLNKAFQLFEEGKIIASNQCYSDLFKQDLTLKEEMQVRLMYGYFLLE